MARRAAWLALAVAFFGVATWVFWSFDREASGAITEKRPPSRYELPHRQRKMERERMLRRQTLLPVPAVAEDVGPRRLGDPVLAALPPKTRRALVFEASAIRDSAIGRLILRCGLPSEALDRIASIQNDGGIDVIDGVERIAVADDVAIASGDFHNARIESLLPSAKRREHGGGVIYEATPEGRRPIAIGTWGNSMLLAARDAAEIERAIDRLEGRAPVAPPIRDEDSYGEIYGLMDPEVLEAWLAADVRDRLRGAAERVELHVDTRDENDVLIVADAQGSDRAAVADLGKSLGAALAVARVTAQSEGEHELATLLDLARVRPKDGSFRVEAALPLHVLERRLCAADGGPRTWRRRRHVEEAR